MPQHNALQDTRGEDVQLRKSHRAPEGNHGKAVGQAAAKRHRGTIGGGPVDKVFREQTRALAQHLRPRLVVTQGGVNQAVKMESHGDVIVFRAAGTVGVPAVAEIVGIHQRKAVVNGGLIVRQAGALKAELDHNGKIVPVAVRHLRVGDLVEPRVQVHHLAPGKVRGEFISQQSEPQTVGRHLHQTLIVRAGFTPVAGALRVGTKLNGSKVLLAERRAFAGCHQRKQPPQRAGKSLHLRNIRCVMGAGITQRES